jgi:hypothetical protein
LYNLVLVLLGGRSEPYEETPSNKRWGHDDWVCVFAFGHGVVRGSYIHVFDDGEDRFDAASGGSDRFPEDVRCPLEAGGRGGPKGTEGLV